MSNAFIMPHVATPKQLQAVMKATTPESFAATARAAAAHGRMSMGLLLRGKDIAWDKA